MFQEAVFTAIFYFLRTKFCRMAQSVFVVETTTMKAISEPVIIYFIFAYSVEGSSYTFI